MNIFNSLKKYAGKWSEVAARDFDQEEIDDIRKAEVVESNYGLSVCFFLISGGQTYIPLDRGSSLAIGDTVDLTKAQLVTLHKDGEADILRVRA